MGKDKEKKDKKDKKDKKKMSKEEKKAAKKAKKEKKIAKRATAAEATSNSDFDPGLVRSIGEHDVQARSGAFGEAAQIGAAEWGSAGSAAGILVWRVEKFHLNAWPKAQYGQFYNGDSYIVLHTQALPGGRFVWDIYFWIGENSTQDEYGTAAFKTVELDNRLGGAATQHREVQDFESNSFLELFPPAITILKGGIDSGFHHVGPVVHRARLLHLKGRRVIRVREVTVSDDSLNAGDVFILDNGNDIYIWQGAQSHVRERQKAGEVATALRNERRAVPVIHTVQQGSEDATFWQLLGGNGPIASAEEGGDDLDEGEMGTTCLMKLSDASGRLTFTEVARGAVRRNMLNTNDVFVYDTGYEIWVWVGRGASPNEKKNAMSYGQRYLTQSHRPPFFPISRIVEGGENHAFEVAFVR